MRFLPVPSLPHDCIVWHFVFIKPRDTIARERGRKLPPSLAVKQFSVKGRQNTRQDRSMKVVPVLIIICYSFCNAGICLSDYDDFYQL